jgi:hypothetical protein
VKQPLLLHFKSSFLAILGRVKIMKRLPIRPCSLLLAAIAAVLATATSMAAQTVVWGTGNPELDVPAVQAAVDQGGEVILKGRFSFERPRGTVPTALAGYPLATVLISKAVAISGAEDDDDMATIEGGTIPFYVEAPGARVEIRRLRFVRPKFDAILVYAVSGLTIASCKVEGVDPVNALGASGIELNTSGAPPSPAKPGKPENITGKLSITNNDINVVGGTDHDNTVGIVVFSVGQSPNKEVDLYISGNHISNITEPAINLRRVGGRAHVDANVITTGPVSSRSAPRPEVIRAVNIGSYVISHNRIHCEWPDSEAIGIGVFSQFPEWPIQRALVVGNDVTMLPPLGTAFGALSAGIDVRGYASDNVVLNNRIRGRARAALAVDQFRGGIPANNAFVLNRLDDFEASRRDIFVDFGVTHTLLLGNEGTVEDHGVDTVIVPFHGSREEK